MPSENEHIKLALHNIDVISYLTAQPQFCDWTTTVTFYTALHIVEAVFYHARKHGERQHGYNHEMREGILKKTTSYQKIWEHYRPLQSASVIARYLHGDSGKAIIFQKYMNPEKVNTKLIKYHLGSLIKSAKKFLGVTNAKVLDSGFQKINR